MNATINHPYALKYAPNYKGHYQHYTVVAIKKMSTRRLAIMYRMMTGREVPTTTTPNGNLYFDRQMLIIVVSMYLDDYGREIDYYAQAVRIVFRPIDALLAQAKQMAADARRSVKDRQVRLIRDLSAEGMTRREISEALGLKLHHVANILRGLAYNNV